MFHMKNITGLVIALSVTSVFAGSIGTRTCDQVNATTPCVSHGPFLGAYGLYLKPSLNDDAQFTLHDVGNKNGVISSYGYDFSGSVPAAYSWGFQIEGGYAFDTGNDLNINWYHIDQGQSNTHGIQPTIIENLGPEGVFSSRSIASSATVDPKWDAVNIELGQYVSFGEHTAIRFHGGAQYARVAANITKSNRTTFGLGVIVEHTTIYNPLYNGFGPRVGADLMYSVYNKFDLYARAAGAVLAGTRSYTARYQDSFTNEFRFNQSTTTVVPEIDTKLGIQYNYELSQGNVRLDIGWLWVNYFNAQETLASNSNDFGEQGLYFGLKWLGRIA